MRKRGYRKKVKFRLRKETIFAIFQIVLLLTSGIIFLSFFQEGPLLSAIRTETDKYFSTGKLLLPVIMLLALLQMSKFKLLSFRPTVLLGLSLVWITLLSMFRSGVIGMTIWDNIEIFLGGLVTGLIMFGVFLIGLMILFETSIEEIMDFLKNTFYGCRDFLNHLTSKTLSFRGKPTVYLQNQLTNKGKIPIQLPLGPAPKPVMSKITPKNQDLGLQDSLVANLPAQKSIWEYPPISLLSDIGGQKADRGDIKTNAQIIERTLESFGIAARVVETNKGPAVTQYALEIAMGTKLSKITGLQNDLALALAAPTGQIRIEAPIPGKSLVGIEIPNRSLEYVTFKTMINSDTMKNPKSKLIVALGLDVSGQPLVSDIAKMPHVLIAGTTGSGKSVLINSWINSILFRATPEEVKLILVDPKRVELVGYNGVPHLMTPVIVEVEKTLSALRWGMKEMDRRYQEFAKMGVRNIDGYNNLSGFQSIPYILIIIDELADLMSFAPVEVEDAICRLAQMARATGIHLILSTQRPSVDVITGLIKANIPCRIAFNVSSMIDSRVILDQPGAEKLLGRGDMLYIPPEQAKPTRIQGTFISEKEIINVVTFLRNKRIENYTDEVTNQPVVLKRQGGGEISADGRDPLFNQAVELICQFKTASSSFLQRKFSIGFSRAARILDQLEAAGAVSAAEGSKPREVLISDPSLILSNQNTTAE